MRFQYADQLCVWPQHRVTNLVISLNCDILLFSIDSADSLRNCNQERDRNRTPHVISESKIGIYLRRISPVTAEASLSGLAVPLMDYDTYRSLLT